MGTGMILACFLLGVGLGWLDWMPACLSGSDAALYMLYALMFSVGMGVGADGRLREILRTLRPRILLVPAATTAGTFAGVALASLFLSYSLSECLAVGAGFGYYSLSSIVITQYKGAELGAVALISNILREIFTLVGASLLVRWCGRLAPVCAGGCTTSDTSLPCIVRFAGRDMLLVAIVHAMLLDFSVPFWVMFFCSL